MTGKVPPVWWWDFYPLGCRTGLLCWAVMCFWSGLQIPRPSQECPNIFYKGIRIEVSVQMGVPLWSALLPLFGLFPTQISQNIGYSKHNLMGAAGFCK